MGTSRIRYAVPWRGGARVPVVLSTYGVTAAAARAVRVQGRELHFKDNYTLPHPVWSKEELEAVAVKHVPPQGFVEHLAYYLMKCLKVGFDVASGFKFGTHDERAWLTRIIFLETVAGVPGAWLVRPAWAEHAGSTR